MRLSKIIANPSRARELEARKGYVSGFVGPFSVQLHITMVQSKMATALIILTMRLGRLMPYCQLESVWRRNDCPAICRMDLFVQRSASILHQLLAVPAATAGRGTINKTSGSQGGQGPTASHSAVIRAGDMCLLR